MKEKFNPKDWLNNDHSSRKPSDITSEVDTVISRIEAALVDITTSYADWVNVGFAFANEFGEAGRSFYLRVSRFYSSFTLDECNKQYDQCLKAQGGGITIRTFFYMARQAGIEVGGRGAGEEGTSDQWSVVSDQGAGAGRATIDRGLAESSSESLSESNANTPCPLLHAPSDEPSDADPTLPTLPDDLFGQLPEFFQQVVSMAASREERDILFLGAMGTLSACLQGFSGIYDGKRVYPNLYLYVTARASAGKGRLILCRNLVNLIHWEKRRESQIENQHYELEIREYNATRSKDFDTPKPEKPAVKMLFIPANNSTTGFFQILSDNDGHGLIFETEGDTIAQAFKTDYGNFSDGFRKAFHHESASYYRRTDREYVEIDHPCVSTVISSTLGQMLSLIPSVENGLASRFMFYFMNIQPVWKDVFAHNSDKSLEEHFNLLGREFYSLYNTLKSKDGIEFRLSEQQQEEFNAFFTQIQDKYLLLQGMDYISIIRRLGLIAFRLMMILTAMRIPETGDFSVKQGCRDEDFQSALMIIKTLVRHASYVFTQIPEEVKQEKRQNKKERFFEALPERFCKREYVELAKSLAITERTASNYITAFCDKGLIVREQVNEYCKVMEN